MQHLHSLISIILNTIKNLIILLISILLIRNFLIELKLYRTCISKADKLQRIREDKIVKQPRKKKKQAKTIENMVKQDQEGLEFKLEEESNYQEELRASSSSGVQHCFKTAVLWDYTHARTVVEMGKTVVSTFCNRA